MRHYPDAISENPQGSYLNCYEPHKQWIDSGLEGFLKDLNTTNPHKGYISREILKKIRVAVGNSMGIEPVFQKAIESSIADTLRDYRH